MPKQPESVDSIVPDVWKDAIIENTQRDLPWSKFLGDVREPVKRTRRQRLSTYLWVRKTRIRDAWAILRHGDYKRTDEWYD